MRPLRVVMRTMQPATIIHVHNAACSHGPCVTAPGDHEHSPMHEGRPLAPGSRVPKYVVRTDVFLGPD